MRKNGVNKEIKKIEGGVCEPKGFQINAGYGGFLSGEQSSDKKEDAALVVADKRYPTACVFPQGAFTIAPVALTQKHLQRGCARAIFVNGGVLNAFDEDRKLTRRVCAELGKRLRVPEEDVLVLSVGKLGKPLSIEPFLNILDGLCAGLCHSRPQDTALKRGYGFGDQVAYAFDLGDFSCKIGALFLSGEATLCLLTTDVTISSEMLQKALSATVRNTFELLDLGENCSPSDAVCIMASGEAGNYVIAADDSEYKKFADALEAALRQICFIMVRSEKEARVLLGRVSGARSKRAARAFAKALVGAENLKNELREGTFSLERTINALYATGEAFSLAKTTVSVCSANGKFVFFEDGKASELSPQRAKEMIQADEIEIRVELGEGNYAATAIGRV